MRDHLIIFRQRGEIILRHHVHDLVAALLKLADQFRQSLGGVATQIVHQDDAFAVLFQLAHH